VNVFLVVAIFLSQYWPALLALALLALIVLWCVREPVPCVQPALAPLQDLRCQAERDAEEVAARAWSQWPVRVHEHEEEGDDGE